MIRKNDLAISACGGRHRGGSPQSWGAAPSFGPPRDIFEAKTGKYIRA
jgi:hypothetical protein